MTLPLSTTLADAKTWLRAHLDKGAHCPCCGQMTKMYKRKINAGMARSLIHMYRISQNGWVHVHAIGARSREEGKLAYWGLVEEQRATGVHGGRAGYWRVTDRGREFLRGSITMPTYAHVYNGKVYNYSGDPVSIKDALGTKFSYTDLMAGI